MQRLVGSHRLMTLKSRWSFSALASQNPRNSRHPCKLIALASWRFLTIPDTFKSSKTIAWLSLTTLVDSLCRKCWRVSAIWLCSLAIWIYLAFTIFPSKLLLLYIIWIYNSMNKSVFFRLTEEELAHLESYCKVTQRTKSDVLRDLIRKLKTNKKPS